MGVPRGRRREIEAHAPALAADLADEYGADADRVLLSCLQHPGYDAAERYCFRRVRRELRRLGLSAARGPGRLATLAAPLLAMVSSRG